MQQTTSSEHGSPSAFRQRRPEGRGSPMLLIHATCVVIGEIGVILRGPSGSGKSDLALRLVDTGGLLVADDQVFLSVENGALVARAPPTISGKLEVRGLGIVE